jgi:uncharacterized protein
MKEWYKFLIILVTFLVFYFFPLEYIPFHGPFFESLALTKWYAREHVILCLIPAFFIAGAISVFINQATVVKYFGAKANKVLSYSVASLSGAILAVCSCTILPLFSGIYKRGAGLGPAIAFLYSGPAINVLAIIMTAQILGWQLGLARAVGAIFFSIIVGIIMHLIFLKEEKRRQDAGDLMLGEPDTEKPLWKNIIYFSSMIGVLVFANWSKTSEEHSSIWSIIYSCKWYMAGLFLLIVLYAVIRWFKKNEIESWVNASWDFAKQIMPLLFIGIVVAGFLLGRPENEGVIPSKYIYSLVGGNSFSANFFAAIAGAFMYFATLTEIPILQGLIGAGMGQGPALALLLAGPALSLPNMLVIRGVLGTRKTIVYVVLVIIMSTLSGIIYGNFF